MASIAQTYARFLQRLGHYRWFAVATKHAVSKVDRALYRLTGGRVTASGPVLPTMLLTTLGRKSGKARTVPVYYLRDQENLVVACENFGLQARSGWPKNLLSHPLARVQIGSDTRWYRAHPVSADEVDHYWTQFLKIWPAMQTYYQRSGERYIFVLEPTTDTDPRLS